MKNSNIDLQTKLMELIDDYAESRHVKGLPHYNEATFTKRQQLYKIIGELVKTPENSVLTFIKGAVLQMEKEIESNEKHLSNYLR